MSAYASESDEEEDETSHRHKRNTGEYKKSASPPPPPPEEATTGIFIGPAEPPGGLFQSRDAAQPRTVLPTSPAPTIVGRYVSKRERAAAASLPLVAKSIQQSFQPPHVVESVINTKVPWSVQQNMKPYAGVDFRSQLPKGLFVQLKAHTKAVTAVRWSPTHGSLLASAGMDCIAHVWNAWSEGTGHGAARSFSSHTAAIKDVQWSPDGACVLTCGFDQTSRLSDVETGCETQAFREDQYVNVVKFHPLKTDLFLSGGSKGVLRLWDIRTGGMVQEYRKGLGQVMDVDFNREGRHFISSSDIADRNASDKTIVVWDFATQIPLSNQVYLEAYTCPCVRYHPLENVFVAQSNGNYIAIFSGHPPFKMNKYKRFESHQVSGYRIQCNFSPDGGLLVSGSSEGQVYIYQYRSTKVLKVLEAHAHVCTDVSYHPSMPSVLASGGWEGNVCIFN